MQILTQKALQVKGKRIKQPRKLRDIQKVITRENVRGESVSEQVHILHRHTHICAFISTYPPTCLNAHSHTHPPLSPKLTHTQNAHTHQAQVEDSSEEKPVSSSVSLEPEPKKAGASPAPKKKPKTKAIGASGMDTGAPGGEGMGGASRSGGVGRGAGGGARIDGS